VQVEFEGVTGRIQFDSQGYRSNFTLDVLEMSFNSRPKKVRTLLDCEWALSLMSIYRNARNGRNERNKSNGRNAKN